MQHWQAADYATWKAEQVSAALHRAGFAASVAPPRPTPPRSRRRMDLALRRQGNGVVVGLHAPRSAEIVDLDECHVLHPELFALLAPLRAFLPGLPALRREGSAVANLLDSGPDLLLRLDTAVDARDRSRLAEFAARNGLARIACATPRSDAEIACQLRSVSHTLAGITVTPPPGAFLQASREGEQAIIQAVLAGLPDRLPKRARIAELFAGIGTLTFALVGHARVCAFEGDAPAALALRSAANTAGLSGRVTAAQRDLARRPLLAAELAGYAAAVLDPPHAGALRQIAELARAAVSRIVYVSCNPATLGRDAGLLRAAGYRLLTATVIDQFLWSARVESVSVFAR